MAELIDKKSALNALSDASYGNFNYVTARNAIDCIRTTTEAEIRNRAIDEFAEKLKKYTYGRTNGVYVEIPLYKVDEIAEQLKEE